MIIRLTKKHMTLVCSALVFFMFAVAMTIYAASVAKITVVCDGLTYEGITAASTVGEVLKEQGISLGKYDKVIPQIEKKLKLNNTITVRRAVPVNFTLADETKKVYTAERTVRDFITSQGIILTNYDEVNVSLDDYITADMEISLTQVDKKIETVEATIPYTIMKIENDNLPKGQINVISAGIDGKKIQKVEKIIVNGKVVEENVIEEAVLSKPVQEVAEYGTQVMQVTSRGENFRFKKMIVCNATAYDLSYQSVGTRPGDPGHGITATGTYAKYGTVAVDPRVIPLGSRLYIESPDGSWVYGYSVAADTGGAIKGNRVDLFFSSHQDAINFGRRTANVYILE